MVLTLPRQSPPVTPAPIPAASPLGQHAAVLYYFILVGIFFVSPPLAYNFSELIEAHAVR